MAIVYFTIGELAKIYGLSKQTLLYYERLGLLVPSKVEDNGYRYYTMKDCERLELILNLKELNLSLKDIQAYVDDKNPRNLGDLFEKARAEYTAQLEELYDKKLKVEMAMYRLHLAESIMTDVVFFQMEEEACYYASPCDFPSLTIKEQEEALLMHKKDILAAGDCMDFYTGYVLPKEAFAAKRMFDFSAYATAVERGQVDLPLTVRPRGLYMVLYIDGIYIKQADAVHEALMRFAENNNLDIVGDLYIEAVRHYWTEEDVSSYIQKIVVAVEPRDDSNRDDSEADDNGAALSGDAEGAGNVSGAGASGHVNSEGGNE